MTTTNETTAQNTFHSTRIDETSKPRCTTIAALCTPNAHAPITGNQRLNASPAPLAESSLHFLSSAVAVHSSRVHRPQHARKRHLKRHSIPYRNLTPNNPDQPPEVQQKQQDGKVQSHCVTSPFAGRCPSAISASMSSRGLPTIRTPGQRADSAEWSG